MNHSPVGGPIIWMNITTSANWKRPPVGIVRVEQAICEELGRIFGEDRFKRCVWLDGQFIEYAPPNSSVSDDVRKAVDSVLPDSASFDLARLFLAKVFSELKPKDQDKSLQHISLTVPAHPGCAYKPSPGDVLVSIGLDWDQSYLSEFYRLRKEMGVRVVTCCYDLIPVLFPQYCVGEVAQKFKEYFIDLSWGSDVVLCISEQTRRDYTALCSQLGAPERKTLVIPLGDNVPIENGDISEQINALIEEPYILFVSTIERRKNHEVLYRAYHLLVQAGYSKNLPKLVFVGMPGWGVGDLLKDIELDPLTKGLILQFNHVNDAELNILYKRACFCVYPSLYEGWGLPVGEALALGKLVVASDCGSLPEVGGDLVKYVDPWNPKAWAKAILDLIENPAEVAAAEKIIREKYQTRSWRQTGIVLASAVSQLVKNPQKEWMWLPGYDMSTQCGIHEGPSIVTTGDSGFLLFGPHWSLSQGNYETSIFGKVGPLGCVGAIVEVAVDQGTHVLAEASLTPFDIGERLATLKFSLARPRKDVEVRVRVTSGAELTINMVKVTCSDSLSSVAGITTTDVQAEKGSGIDTAMGKTAVVGNPRWNDFHRRQRQPIRDERLVEYQLSADSKVGTKIGRCDGAVLLDTGVAGCLLHGDKINISLEPGHYTMAIHGKVGISGAWADVCLLGCKTILAEQPLQAPEEGQESMLAALHFALDRPCKGLEVRVWAGEHNSDIQLDQVKIWEATLTSGAQVDVKRETQGHSNAQTDMLAQRYWATHPNLHSQVGHTVGQCLNTTGKVGYLLYGPYVALLPGRYMATVHGAACLDDSLHGAWMDVAWNKGVEIATRQPLHAAAGELGLVHFELPAYTDDLEVRVFVTAESYLRLDGLTLVKMGKVREDYAAQAVALSSETDQTDSIHEVQTQGNIKPEAIIEDASVQKTSTAGTVAQQCMDDGDLHVPVEAETELQLVGMNTTEKTEKYVDQAGNAILTLLATDDTSRSAESIPNSKEAAPQPRKKNTAEWAPDMAERAPPISVCGPNTDDTTASTGAVAKAGTALTTNNATRPTKSTVRVTQQYLQKPKKRNKAKS